MRTRRSLQAAVAAGLLATTLSACSLLAGEPGGEGGAARTPSAGVASAEVPAGGATAGGAPAGPQTIQASNVTARIPGNWVPVPDQDPWRYIYQLPNDAGGVAGQIRFLYPGTAMGPQEAVDWFVGQIEGTGETRDDFAPVTALRQEANRANTSYTYTSGGRNYVAVVWGLSDGNGAPSLVQVSGQQTVVTPDLVARVDRSLDLTGDLPAPAR
ncbi:hypothetical protein [Myceligenerans crystallogenes]|uniref:Lipoprotein LpqN n=1 Tax=Myceligenerans crystallogenes TaxID=316335 RepID=A0ABN2N419_9MICO